MAPPTAGAILERAASPEADLRSDLDDFSLNVSVIEASQPVPNLMRSTSDGCGSSCAGACASYVDDPI